MMTKTDNVLPTNLYLIEEGLHNSGLICVCGIDEAGRGPLMGPVVAGAVIIPKGVVIDGINDSKKLSEGKREALYSEITQRTIWSVGMASHIEIDEINILNATMLAMTRALEALPQTPDYVLVDGNKAPKFLIPTETIVSGDANVACIAAASIIAKVTRDRILNELDIQYPQYGFARHKGYGTKAHYEALKEYGMLECYRRSFFKKHKI